MDQIKISPPKKTDFEQIFDLLKQLWPEKELNKELLTKIFLRGILSVEQYYLMAELNKKVVGFTSLTIKNSLWQEGNLAHVDELIVDNQYRNKGIGKKLLERLCMVAKQNNCRKIELDSAFQREGAHEFYRNMNFQDRGFIFSRDL